MEFALHNCLKMMQRGTRNKVRPNLWSSDLFPSIKKYTLIFLNPWNNLNIMQDLQRSKIRGELQSSLEFASISLLKPCYERCSGYFRESMPIICFQGSPENVQAICCQADLLHIVSPASLAFGQLQHFQSKNSYCKKCGLFVSTGLCAVTSTEHTLYSNVQRRSSANLDFRSAELWSPRLLSEWKAVLKLVR